MPNYTQGSTRVRLQQPDLTTFQANGSVVLDSRRTRPLWFDGRFLAARDLDREQNYFLQREADLGQAGGFGVMSGLLVERGSNAQTIVVQAGSGITPAGELVSVSTDLTLSIAELIAEEILDVQFGLAPAPAQPPQSRTGLFAVALRPIEFTADPIGAFPTTVQGSRSRHDSDIVEATAVTLIPYPNPAAAFAPSLQQAALARQIFVSGNPTTLPDSLLPLALVSVQQGAVVWVDPYLVRRDTGPQFQGVRFGLTDPATQQAYLMQYDMRLQSVVAARLASGLKANFAAADFFQALPPAGRFPIDAIDTSAFSQVFFPQQMDVRLSIVPQEELPALLEESMSLPPIDLTLPSSAYANLAVFAFVPVPLANFVQLKSSLPFVPLNPILPQVLANRTPIELLRLYRGDVTFTTPPPIVNSAWANAVGGQKYGFFLRRRSAPTFVKFETPLNLVLTSSPNPSLQGQQVTFTVKATPASATGGIQFMEGPNALGSGNLSQGAASFLTSTLTVGAHSVVAVYAGDAENAANTSNIDQQTVNKAPSKTAVTSSVNPANVGQSVTFTASVTPNSATGSVKFQDGASVLATQTLSGGAATFATSSLALGAHSITAAYSGDANLAASTSPALGENVVKAASTVTLASSANPATVGHAVTFTATVTPASATGSVQFFDGATVLGAGTLTTGVATFTTSSLAVGAHSITASYAGDAATNASVSAPLTQSINENVSSVTVNSSINPSVVGQAVTFTAQVTPATATGTVKFLDGSNTLGTATLTGGAAALAPNSSLPVGAHSITAFYSGDANDQPANSASLVQTVTKAATSVTLSSSVNPSTVGQAITLTANVTPKIATGSVQFQEGGASLGSATVTNGVATLGGLTTLAAGAHAIIASYGGDGNNAASTSTPLTQTVGKQASSVALKSSPNPSTFGQTVTFTAEVTPASATGSLQFLDGTAVLGTATIASGAASLAIATLSVGSHNVIASYGGDGSTAASVSPPVAQTVAKVATTVALASPVNPSTFGQSVTFTAKVSPASATGSVQFRDGANSLGSVAVNGAAAALAVSTLTVGSHSVTAIYSGDANNAGSTSSPVVQGVAQVKSSVTLTASPPGALFGTPIVFTARVTPANATGSVTFLDSGKTLGSANLVSGVASFDTATLAVGGHTVTASYAGDANDAGSVSGAVQVSITILTIGTTPQITVTGILFHPGVTKILNE